MPEEQLAQDPAEEAAGSYLAGAVERSGLQIPEAEEEAPESVRTPPPAQERATPEPGEQRQLSNRAADYTSWRERRERRNEQMVAQAVAAQQQRLTSQLEEWAKNLPAQQGQPAPVDDTPPDWENFAERMAWEREQTLKAQREMLAPILESHQRFQTLEQQRAEQAAQERYAYEQEMARRSVAEESVQWYQQLPESEGFGTRLAWYVGHPGDPRSGIEPVIGADAQSLIDAGIPPQVAIDVARERAKSLSDFFAHFGIPPAAGIDRMIRSSIIQAGTFFLPPGGGAQPATQQPAQQAHQPSPRIQAAKAQAAKAQGVVGGPSSGGGASADTVEALFARGEVNPKAMADFARRHKIPVSQVATELRRLVAQSK